MKRITLILGVVAVMAAMMVALAAPAMADNNRQDNRQENRQDRQDNRQDHRFTNNHDKWFDNERDNVDIRFVSDSVLDSDDLDSFYPYWGWGPYPYWGSYDDCGFDWDGPVTPVDCWD